MRLSAAVARGAAAVLMTGASLGGQATPQNDWENPQVVGINKLEPHATLIPFPDRAAALTRDPGRSSFIQTLNGRWKFHWSPNPDSRPRAFHQETVDAGGWVEIEVPSNAELQGYGRPCTRGDPRTLRVPAH